MGVLTAAVANRSNHHKQAATDIPTSGGSELCNHDSLASVIEMTRCEAATLGAWHTSCPQPHRRMSNRSGRNPRWHWGQQVTSQHACFRQTLTGRKDQARRSYAVSSTKQLLQMRGAARLKYL